MRVPPFMDRLLDQEYVHLNLPLIKQACQWFDVKNPLCRSCRFYSQFYQQQKTGAVCHRWHHVFGTELRKMMESLVNAGAKINLKFYDIWKNRRVAPAQEQAKAFVASDGVTDSVINSINYELYTERKARS